MSDVERLTDADKMAFTWLHIEAQRRYFESQGAIGLSLIWPLVRASLAIRWRKPGARLFGIREGKRLIAGAIVYPRQNCLKLPILAVDPSCQGRGLGRLMVEFVIELARAEGYQGVSYDCIEQMADARSFFIHMGFRPVTECDFGEGWTGCVMELRI